MLGRMDVIRQLTHERPAPGPSPPPSSGDSDGWTPHMAALKEAFQAALRAQHAALVDIDARIVTAKHQLAELEALKASWEQQLAGPAVDDAADR